LYYQERWLTLNYMDVIRTDRHDILARSEERRRQAAASGGLPGSYSRAGVDEQREQTALRRAMLPWFAKTRAASEAESVLGVAAGHFATLVRLSAGGSVALTTDGVGTKILVARMAEQYDTVGMDCVANNVNDLICIGAKPLVLLDYIAIDRIDEEVLGEIARGLSEGAQLAGVEIAGGEIAQVKDLLASTDNGPPMFDLVGMALGILPDGASGQADQVLDGSQVCDGDVVLGLPSSGLHSNGYSLARRVLFEKNGLDLSSQVPDDDRLLGEILLEPTKIYVKSIQALHDAGVTLHGLVNITGGGLLNLTRLNASVSYILDDLPSAPPPIFGLIREIGRLNWAEMFTTFNMGVGLCIILPKRDAELASEILKTPEDSPFILGHVEAGRKTHVSLPAYGLTGSGETFIPAS
jgi:phosphoribosylformylglycinamidine cyclo-ligase